MLIGGGPIFQRIGEAVDAARHSIWLTIAFYTDNFCFPDGRGSLFDALDRAVARGVDVRVVVWRPNPEVARRPNMFIGSSADRDLLGKRGSRIKIRWDRIVGVFCQHQKSWVIDAGQPSQSAFVGGANLGAPSFEFHDVYLEVAGPAVTDVHHNFVQRWNEASEREKEDGSWNCDAAEVLPFPVQASGRRGSSIVQIQRMLQGGLYRDGRPTPGGNAFDVAQGERSVLEQYERAIDAAKRTIYLENQAIPVMSVAGPLVRALERGVDVVLLAPAKPEDYVYAARHDPNQRPRFEGIDALGRYPNFLFAGIAKQDGESRHPVYVHSKHMVVDNAWATIGSCNLHAFSLAGHSEMNASIWDEEVVRDFRRRLFALHLGLDVAHLDDRAAVQLYCRVAQENRAKMEAGDTNWQGNVFALSPERYGLT